MPDKELQVMKAPSIIVPLKDISYPKMYSTKFDGYRAIIKKGKVYSSTMREYKNPNLLEILDPLLCQEDYVFDGELFASKDDFESLGAIRSDNNEMPEGLKFHVFDCLEEDDWITPKKPFLDRYIYLKGLSINSDKIVIVKQTKVEGSGYAETLYNNSIDEGHEGGILRCPNAPYKHGRATVKEDFIFKVKAFETCDGKVLEVKEMWGLKDGVERKKSPTGHTIHNSSMKDREPKNTFGYFVVEVHSPDYPTGITMEIGGWKGLTKGTRKSIWNNKEKYIGRWVRFESMKVGSSKRPRIPKNLQFRDDK